MSNVRNQPQRAATLRRTYEDDGYPFESQSEPSEAEFNQSWLRIFGYESLSPFSREKTTAEEEKQIYGS